MKMVVHMGLGNFHRAHQAVYTRDASPDGEWRILGVARSSAHVVSAMRQQGMAYSVLVLSPDETRRSLVNVHQSAFIAEQEPARLVNSIAAPDTHVVTLTITEKGYMDSPQQPRQYSMSAADLAKHWRRSSLGLLTLGLVSRADQDSGPLTILSCDNMVSNGQLLGSKIRQLAEQLRPDEGRRLIDYLNNQVTFPDSMVDRIVPATTAEHRSFVRRQGYVDDIPVATEADSWWAIEDNFVTERPAWERAGAVLTHDVRPYQTLKLRLVNATNSFLAYVGIRAGHSTIAASLETPEIQRAAWHLGSEMLSTFSAPSGMDLPSYRAQLFSRMRNGALAHTTRQVGMDGSLKLRQRLSDPVGQFEQQGREAPAAALLVAAWLHCLLQGSDGSTQGVVDPQSDEIQRLFAATSGLPSSFVPAVLVDSAILGPTIASSRAFVAQVEASFKLLSTASVQHAIRSIFP